MSHREERARRRAELTGSGPVREDRPIARFPGAAAKFALFGEVMLVGILVALGGLLIVTLPAALAAGMRHLRRFLHAEGSPMRAFWRDYASALPSGSLVGLGAGLIAGVLALDVVVAGSGGLPGGPLIAAFGWAGLVIVASALLMAAASWSPEAGWRDALRATARQSVTDRLGALYIAAAVVLTGVVTWMLFLLLIPALGCAALAAVAVPHRRRR